MHDLNTNSQLPANAAGNGAAYRWLMEHVDYDGVGCLIWPFMLTNGYGQFGYLGERYYAHRYMCELVCGPPPTADHEAGHLCGRGHEGCVHPKHLSWKTPSENQRDRASHGTKNTWGQRGKLTLEQIDQIRALKGKKTQKEIAALFGISRSNVSFILLGKAWNALPRAITYQNDRGKWRVKLRDRDGLAIYIEYFDHQDEAKAAYALKVGEYRIRDLASIDD